jgi:epoxyqueuosine reductase
MMESLTAEFRAFVKEKGVDLLGIASIERSWAAPERFRPQYYLRDARAVVSIGQRITEALVEALRDKRSAFSFQHFVNDKLYDQLDVLCYDAARFLETKGYRAYPVPAQNPKDPTVMIGELSHKHAAVAAGLGQIGWNNLFLTPQFGPRQILCSVITDAPLEADPLYGGRVCKPEECGYACIGVCPTNAISRIGMGFEMEGRRFEHGTHSKWRCIWGCGSMSSIMPMPRDEVPIHDLMVGQFREELQKVRKANVLPEAIQNSLFLAKITKGEIPWCWLACLTSCPVGSRSPT